MELSRRDALVALGAAGAAGGAIAVADRVEPPATQSGTVDLLPTLEATARVLYPSAVQGIGDFVERYVVGRTADRPEYRRGMADAVATIDERANSWYDAPFVDLDRATRDALLSEIGTETAAPDPDGSDAERIRYYVVNELLFALYTSPTGGRLVGIENPIGYPGGIGSYRRGPIEE